MPCSCNVIATNGRAPGMWVASSKFLASGFGALTSWVVSGLVSACSSPDVDVVNMSIEGSLHPAHEFSADDYLLVTDAVSYCRAHGVAVFGAAGNAHVRVDRVNMNVGGRSLSGVGRVSPRPEGIASVPPGNDSAADFDLRGTLVVPAGGPGRAKVFPAPEPARAAPASRPPR